MEREQIGRIPGLNKEQEPRPIIHVEFYGYNHSQRNLQGVNNVRNHLENLLEKGGVTFFLEDAANSKRFSSLREKLTKHRDYHILLTASHLAKIDGRSHSEREVKEHVDRVERAWKTDPETVIKTMIPEDSLQQYFLFKFFDEIVPKGELKVEFETHHGTTLETLKSFSVDEERFHADAYHNWDSGRLGEAIKSHRQFVEALFRGTRLREIDIVDSLKDIIKRMHKANKGGSLFILFGGGHAPMIDALKRKVAYRKKLSGSILFESYTSISPSYRMSQIMDCFRNKKLIDDLLFAQMMFCEEADMEIDVAMKRKDKRFVLAMNYETITAEMENLAASLSLADIRRICEKQISMDDVLRSNSQLARFLN